MRKMIHMPFCLETCTDTVGLQYLLHTIVILLRVCKHMVSTLYTQSKTQ